MYCPVPKLKGKQDYNQWRIMMETHLKATKLFKYVEEEIPKDADQEIFATSKLALCQIHQAIDMSIFWRIILAKSAKKAWDILERAYGGVTKVDKYGLWCKEFEPTLEKVDKVEAKQESQLNQQEEEEVVFKQEIIDSEEKQEIGNMIENGVESIESVEQKLEVATSDGIETSDMVAENFCGYDSFEVNEQSDVQVADSKIQEENKILELVICGNLDLIPEDKEETTIDQEVDCFDSLNFEENGDDKEANIFSTFSYCIHDFQDGWMDVTAFFAPNDDFEGLYILLKVSPKLVVESAREKPRQGLNLHLVFTAKEFAKETQACDGIGDFFGDQLGLREALLEHI